MGRYPKTPKDLRSPSETKIINHNWLGSSDTETLLVAFEQLGIKETIQHCVGMFSFAVWDAGPKAGKTINKRM